MGCEGGGTGCEGGASASDPHAPLRIALTKAECAPVSRSSFACGGVTRGSEQT
jgi:hypothetical protein